jgi:hypothetical protein
VIIKLTYRKNENMNKNKIKHSTIIKEKRKKNTTIKKK